MLNQTGEQNSKYFDIRTAEMLEGAADDLPEVLSTRNSPQPHQVQHLEAAYI
jgi:hypothetical protein